MEYQVLYDFMNAPSEWRNAWFGLRFVAIGFTLVISVLLYGRFTGKPYRDNLVFCILWTTFVSLWSVIELSSTVPDYYRYRNKFDQQQYMIVEGSIQGFRINERGTWGKFSVNEAEFVLDYHRIGFDAGDPERRVLAEDMVVRVYYIEESGQFYQNPILRLEVKKPP